MQRRPRWAAGAGECRRPSGLSRLNASAESLCNTIHKPPEGFAEIARHLNLKPVPPVLAEFLIERVSDSSKFGLGGLGGLGVVKQLQHLLGRQADDFADQAIFWGGLCGRD